MTSPYRDIISSKTENIFYLLSQLQLDVIFDDLTEVYEGDLLLTKAVKFIVYCFSVDSDKITVNGDRRKEKAAIFKELSIDPGMYKDFILLEEPAVAKAAQKWLRYQDNAQFEYLVTLKEAYVQQQAAALQPLERSSGGTDWDQKFKCIEHMTALKKMIKDAESELLQNDPKMKEAYEEIKKAIPKNITLGPENYSW